MAKALNSNIRQRSCNMEVTTAILNNFDNSKKGKTADVGKAVSLDSDGKVDIGTTGEEIFGQLQSLGDDGVAAIIDDGFIDFDIEPAATITYGGGPSAGLVCGTNGTVKTGTSATCRAICALPGSKVRAKMI